MGYSPQGLKELDTTERVTLSQVCRLSSPVSHRSQGWASVAGYCSTVSD